jgi:citronellol/citronellal dehydrogenase
VSASQIFRDGLLDGKVAIVTGGGTGIGKAIALELGRLGADLAIASRRVENLEPAAERIRAETGRRCFFVACDLRDADQVETMVARVEAEYGRLDVLVNNAGGQFPAAAESFSIKGWNTVVNNNLNAVWYATQAAARRMIGRGGGRIITITADYRGGMPGIAHSSAARAAVRNLARTLATEWARHGILVNTVAPGTIRTEAFDRVYDDVTRARSEAEQPLGRLGRPEEIAWAVAYLVSPAGDFVTGAEIEVNGGHVGPVWTIPEPAK